MRINEDYLENISDDDLKQNDVEVEDTRSLPFQFRIVSRDDYNKHLNTEEQFRRSLDKIVTRVPNIKKYKITSVMLPSEQKDNSISATPTFIWHKDSMDFIAEFEMDIHKFSTLSSLWRFLYMLHDSVRGNIDDIILYFKLDTSTDTSSAVGYIDNWYILRSLVNHSLDGYSRCGNAKTQFLNFAEVLTNIQEDRLEKEIYEFLQFWDDKRIFIEMLTESTEDVLDVVPYDEKRINGRLDSINDMLKKKIKYLNINKAISEYGTDAVFFSIYKSDASKAFTQFGRREPFRPSWVTTWGKECEFGRGCQSFAREVALSGKKEIQDFRSFMIKPSPGSRDSRVVIVFSYGIIVDPDNELELCGCSLIIPYKKTAEILNLINS